MSTSDPADTGSAPKPAALVTGGSRGIGRAVSLALARSGRHVLINYLSREEDARRTLDEIVSAGGTGELLPFDVRDTAACAEAVGSAIGRHEGIEVLVNNAGVRRDTLMVWMEEEDWRGVIETNLSSFYNVTRLVVKDMILRRRGRIVTIASTSGQIGVEGQVNYSAAKAGLIGASRALAREVARRGITVNVVSPGFIETEMLEGMDPAAVKKMIPMRRLGRPEEVAGAVAYLCGPDAGYVTGAVLNVNGGMI